MKDKEEKSLLHTSFWFKEPGPESDVVISSRIRLGRNISGHCFPGTMSAEEEEAVREHIAGAFRKIPSSGDYSEYFTETISPLEKKLLLERNIFSQEFSIARNKSVVLNTDGLLSVLINETDHLRITSLKGGFALKEAYMNADAIDSELETLLNYAVSLEWGYLSASLTQIGTHMRASYMVHLPALVYTSLIAKAIKTITSLGVSVKGYFGDGEESLGDIYQISNLLCIGMSEKEIIENLEGIVLQLVNYERRARDEIVEKERITVLDKIFRALGTLLYCRSINSKDAIDLLSMVRLGVSLKLITGITVEAVTALFFLSQKYHIQMILGNIEDVDFKLIDYTRAKIIRETLSNAEITGGE